MTVLCLFMLIALHHHLFLLHFFSLNSVTPCSLSLPPPLHVSYLDECISTLTYELEFWGLREQTSQVLQNCALILKINRGGNHRRFGAGEDTETQKRGNDGEEAWNAILYYQNQHYMIVEKGAFQIIQPLHFFWPQCSSPELFITEIEEVLTYGFLRQGSSVKMFALLRLFL